MSGTVFVTLLAGAAAPVVPGSASEVGSQFAAGAGWRYSEGVVVQPEVVVRATPSVPVASVAPGVALGVDGLVAAGLYGHATVGIVGYPLPGADAGLWAEVLLLPDIRPTLRVGWEWDRPARYKCGDCPQPAEHWLAIQGGIVFRI